MEQGGNHNTLVPLWKGQIHRSFGSHNQERHLDEDNVRRLPTCNSPIFCAMCCGRIAIRTHSPHRLVVNNWCERGVYPNILWACLHQGRKGGGSYDIMIARSSPWVHTWCVTSREEAGHCACHFFILKDRTWSRLVLQQKTLAVPAPSL